MSQTSSPSFQSQLEDAAVAAREYAIEVDETGTFPSRSLDAVRKAGLLGLISSREVGGLGEGPRAAAEVVERLARECGSTAMVVCMHYSGTAVLEKLGSNEVRRAVARGDHLSTLAFSETGSRSHFWAPVSTSRIDGDEVVLDAKKSWVTSASHATAYVWSSKPAEATGEASTIWLVPRQSRGISVPAPFNGLGLRGNDSSAVNAAGVRIPVDNRLGEDGKGFGVMMEIVLPLFNLLASACTLGLMEAAVARTCKHASSTTYEHLQNQLRDLPTVRNYIARMRVETDKVRTLWLDTIAAMETGREDTMLRVLECKAAAGEAATSVLDLGMRVCGGAAFRRDVGVERYFRDTRAAGVMAPTTDVLYDFIGKAVCDLPLF